MKQIFILLLLCIDLAYGGDKSAFMFRGSTDFAISTPILLGASYLQKESRSELGLEYRKPISLLPDFEVGFGISRLNAKYTRYPDKDDSSVTDDYDLNFNYAYFRFGYLYKLAESQLIPSVWAGSGNLSLEGSDDFEKSTNAQIWGCDVEFKSSMFDQYFYSIGLGYSWFVHDDLKSNNIEIDKNELRPGMSLRLGIGIEL